MNKRNNKLKYLILPVLLLGLIVIIGCDDDDEDTTDVITYDEFLTGKWYRFLFREDAPSNDFRPCRLEIDEEGNIEKYLDNSTSQAVSDTLLELGYVIVNYEYREFLRENNMETWRGGFGFSADSATVVFYNDSGYVDQYVKENDGIDTLVVGQWELELMTVDGAEQDIGNNPLTYTFYDNGLMAIEGQTSPYRWFVNSNFIVIPNEEEMVYYSKVLLYSLASQDTRLNFTFNRLESVDGEQRAQNVNMRFVRIE